MMIPISFESRDYNSTFTITIITTITTITTTITITIFPNNGHTFSNTIIIITTMMMIIIVITKIFFQNFKTIMMMTNDEAKLGISISISIQL